MVQFCWYSSWPRATEAGDAGTGFGITTSTAVGTRAARVASGRPTATAAQPSARVVRRWRRWAPGRIALTSSRTPRANSEAPTTNRVGGRLVLAVAAPGWLRAEP